MEKKTAEKGTIIKGTDSQTGKKIVDKNNS